MRIALAPGAVGRRVPLAAVAGDTITMSDRRPQIGHQPAGDEVKL